MTAPSEPTVFGRYQLLEPLAKGGMAEVFKARLVAAAGAEKLLCIKRILPHLSRNHDFLGLFVKEAKVALPLTHGNITQVFDFGEENGVYYLAMEYIAGKNLHEVLQRVREQGEKIDIGAALYIAAEVCKGLQYAHSYTDGKGKAQAVVHRDVTPHNILISYNGEVKLTDFGIALAAAKAGGGDEGVVRGKACYLSPEQADGDPGTPRSDIFSLGTVLFEMLTGIRPFEADTEAETLRKVKALEVESPSRFNPAVDEAIDAIVLRAMARDQGQRFARAGDMQVALTQAIHQRWPDYTAGTLSHLLRQLFAPELARLEEGSEDPLRDHLLFQLSQAGVPVDPGKASTGDLLELGTVAISSASRRRARSLWRRPLTWGLGGMGLVLLGVAVGLFAWPGRGGDSRAVADAGEQVTPLGSTEHLQPPSVREEPAPPRAGTGSAAPAPREKQVGESPRRATAAPAFLNCNSWPWSVVYLDGRRLRGNTPLFRIKVTSGKHQLRFVNPELGMSKEVEVALESGATKTVAVTLHQ